MDILEYIALALEVLGVFYNIKKNPICWYLWIVGDLYFLLHSVIIKDYPLVVLFLVYMVS